MHGRGFRNREVANTGLNGRCAGQRIDGEDPAEFCQRQHDAVRIRHRAAGKARPGAARNHGNARVEARLENGDDLRLVLGQKHRGGTLAKERKAIAFVGSRVLRGRQQRSRRQDRRELRVYRIVEHEIGTRLDPWAWLRPGWPRQSAIISQRRLKGAVPSPMRAQPIVIGCPAPPRQWPALAGWRYDARCAQRYWQLLCITGTAKNESGRDLRQD